MQRYEAVPIIQELLDKHNFGHIRIVWNSKRRGIAHVLFSTDCSGKYQIEELSISKFFIYLNDEQKIREVALHEIAHMYAGCDGRHHGRKWQLWAMKLGVPTTATTKAEMAKGRYKGTCPNCGKVYYKHRAGKHVKRPGWKCKSCGGKFNFVDTGTITVLKKRV